MLTSLSRVRELASAPARALADGAREAQDRVRRGGQAAYEALRELPADLTEAVSVLADGARTGGAGMSGPAGDGPTSRCAGSADAARGRTPSATR